jgi:hypothetical protein
VFPPHPAVHGGFTNAYSPVLSGKPEETQVGGTAGRSLYGAEIEEGEGLLLRPLGDGPCQNFRGPGFLHSLECMGNPFTIPRIRSLGNQFRHKKRRDLRTEMPQKERHGHRRLGEILAPEGLLHHRHGQGRLPLRQMEKELAGRQSPRCQEGIDIFEDLRVSLDSSDETGEEDLEGGGRTKILQERIEEGKGSVLFHPIKRLAGGLAQSIRCPEQSALGSPHPPEVPGQKRLRKPKGVDSVDALDGLDQEQSTEGSPAFVL